MKALQYFFSLNFLQHALTLLTCTFLKSCSTRTYFARITKRFGKNLMRIMFFIFFHESDNAISKTDVFSGTVLPETPTVWVWSIPINWRPSPSWIGKSARFSTAPNRRQWGPRTTRMISMTSWSTQRSTSPNLSASSGPDPNRKQGESKPCFQKDRPA